MEIASAVYQGLSVHGAGREIAYSLHLISPDSSVSDDQNEAQKGERVCPKSLKMDMNQYLSRGKGSPSCGPENFVENFGE